MTNLEIIKNMSAGALAEFINNAMICCCFDDCKICPFNETKIYYGYCCVATIEKWLESEVK
ncbi:MAG: hypothetical protein ACI4XP_05350 [Acutalibacteraceae bacterium]